MSGATRSSTEPETKRNACSWPASTIPKKKLVAYIAPKPPPDRLKSLASMYGRKVVYIPIGQFSPATLKKMRGFHVLDGREARDWAGEYIG